jgi:acetolactate synthase-like protein
MTDEENTAQARVERLRNHLSMSPTSESSAQWLRRVAFGSNPESNLHAGDLVTSTLLKHGVKFIFTLSGGHISPILVGAEEKGIRVIDVRHEVNAVFAADAVARLSGKCGVAAVTAGPGVTNTITAIKNCQMAQSPIVLLGGAAATMLKGRGSLQDIDQRAIMEPIVKKCFTVTSVPDIVSCLREAFQTAQSGTPGPVFVELPLDILYSYLEIASGMNLYVRKRRRYLEKNEIRRVVVPEEKRPMSRRDFIAQLKDDDTIFLRPDEDSSSKDPWYAKAFMQYKLRHIFADSRNIEYDFSPLPLKIPRAPLASVEKAASFVRTAQRPVLVLGSQSVLPVHQVLELRRQIESMGIPTFLGGMSRGLLGRNASLHIRQGRGNALRRSDCVILAGAVADFRLQYGRALPRKGARIVACNRSSESLNLNKGLFWNADLAIQADPCDFLISLSQCLSETSSSKFASWASELKSLEIQKERKNEIKAREIVRGRGKKSSESLINPLALLSCLESELPEKSILVADGGDFVATASYIVRPRGPLTWLDPGAYGTLGVGAGFALGAKLVNPESEVWIIWGDGSSGYSIAEFDTFSRHNIPVIGLVGNDACWSQIEREQTPMFGSPTACNLDYCAYDKVAEGYGGVGLVLRSPDDDILGVMRKAQKTCRSSGRPVLINALIGKSDFREGSLSV